MATATEMASATATAGGDTKTAATATQRWQQCRHKVGGKGDTKTVAMATQRRRQQQHKDGSNGDTKTAATATATVITATRATTKMMTQIGERRGGRERDLSIDGAIKLRVIMVGQFMATIRCQTGVSHLLPYLRSHQNKKRTSRQDIWDTKCQTCVRHACQTCMWTVPSRKKLKNQQINKHASRISANLGHPIEVGGCVIPPPIATACCHGPPPAVTIAGAVAIAGTITATAVSFAAAFSSVLSPSPLPSPSPSLSPSPSPSLLPL